MNREAYSPGPANMAHVEKDGENWTLVVVKELRHSPEKVWKAITDPDELKEWAPFDADKPLTTGATVTLTTVGAPKEYATQSEITKAEEPHLLELKWGDHETRWQLEPQGEGTRLTLWAKIPRPYIAMGAAGWHLCFDVMDHYLGGDPIGRTVGPDAMKVEGWQQLHKDYAAKFGVEMPKW